jgi:hypothetical protein
MTETEIETRLAKKIVKFPKVCTSCDKQIEIGEVVHQEEGVNQHLHSLLARSYCSDCYAKYGEKKLLKGNL